MEGMEWTTWRGAYIPLFPYWLMLFFVGFFMIFWELLSYPSREVHVWGLDENF